MTDHRKATVTERTKNLEGASDEGFNHIDGFRRWLRHISTNLWLWELGSLLVSTASVGAIIVVMMHYDNEPLPSWKYGLTINGLISILAVLAKSSLILPIAEAISQLKWHWYWKQKRPILDFQVLDAASRGPWGCFVLLLRPRQWSFVSIGGVITILALLMEPSLQLMPVYAIRQVESGTSSIPRSFYYKDYFSAPDPRYDDRK